MWQILRLKEDIIVTTTASEHLGLLVLLHQTLKRKKVVFRLAHDYNYDVSRYKQISRRYYTLYKYGLMHAKGLVAQTKHQQDALNKIGLKSVIIKNGFEIPEVKGLEKKWVLWVARSKPMKRPELFIELAIRVPYKEFVMIMPTNNNKKSIKLKEQIEARIEHLDNVTLIDYVDPPHVIQDYFDKAMLFVNSSTFEGFPNTFIQAGMGQTPVLSFTINPDGMFDDSDIGILCNEDVELGAKYVEDLTLDQSLRQGQSMRDYVIKEHSIEVATKAYKELMEAML